MSQKLAKIPTSKAKNAYELLSEVCALIKAEPKRYDQGTYIKRGRGEHYPACGTVGCVAGWVATLKGPKNFSYNQTASIARRILGHELEYELDDLFDGGAIGEIEGQTHKSARLGVRMIRAFQKANKAQLKAKKV